MGDFNFFWPTGDVAISTTIASILGAVVIAALVGYTLQRAVLRYRKSARRTDRMESQENFLVSGILVLLALMLAFTTGFVVERYDERRLLVVEEANAIGTAYLESQALAEPHRTRLSNLLIEYTDNRIALSTTPRDRRTLLARNDQLLTKIWAALLATNDDARGKAIVTPLFLSFSEVMNYDTERKVSRLTEVPQGILVTLYAFLVVTAAILGAVLNGTRQRIIAGILFLLLTLAIAMIVDLNRPTRGVIRESEQALLLVRDSMKVPRSVFDQFR